MERICDFFVATASHGINYFYLRPKPKGPVALRVVVVVVIVVIGKVFVCPLDDLLAQCHSNNLSRSYSFRKTDQKKFLCVTNQFQENHKKI